MEAGEEVAYELGYETPAPQKEEIEEYAEDGWKKEVRISSDFEEEHYRNVSVTVTLPEDIDAEATITEVSGKKAFAAW